MINTNQNCKGARYYLTGFFTNVSPTQVRAKSFIYYFLYGKPLLLASCYSCNPILNEEWLTTIIESNG